MRTSSTKKHELSQRWFIVDATDRPLGRLATQVAKAIRGKNRVEYQPYTDTGDFVIVINAEKVKLTGNKLDQKAWERHSQTPGGFRAEPYKKLIVRRPDWIIEKAVYGMLPKNRLGRTLHGKLKVYKGGKHPHAAQKPAPLPV